MSKNATTVVDNPVLKIFPTPEFLAMPAIGVSVTDTSIRFIELLNHKGKIVLGDYGSQHVENNVISGGAIQDVEAVTDIINELKQDFDFEFVRVALPEQKGYLYKTEVPYVEENDVRDSVEFTIEQNVPMSLEEAIFDFDIAAIRPDDNAIDVVVTAFPRGVIENYTVALESAGLMPLSFELEAHAVARSVVSEGDTRTYIIVNLKPNKVGLYVVSGGVIYFTSTLDLGTESLTGFSGVAAMRQSYEHDGASGDEERQRHVQALKGEIEKLNDFWLTHNSAAHSEARHVERVIVCGEGASDDVFIQSLTAAVDIDVIAANVWRNAFSFEDYIPEIPFEKSLGYAAAIGLALPE